MRRLLILLLLALFALAGPCLALEVPQNKPSNDAAALERKLQQQTEMPSGTVRGFVHIPDQKADVLVQPMGRTFRDVRMLWQPWIDLGLIIVALGAMALLYFVGGSAHYHPDPAGRKIQRFNAFERFAHWLTAVSFIWLALTGLNLVWGRWVLEPILGDNAFAAMSHWAKVSHNAVAFAFMVGLVIVTVQWLRHNIPSRLDWFWIKSGGGMFGGPHPPAEKFNAGQKMIYWATVFGGGLITLTGIALLLPFYAVDITGMQIMHLVHSMVAALMIAVIIGHVYLGTLGIRGSFDAMATGDVDWNWAHEHHSLWAEKEAAKARAPAE